MQAINTETYKRPLSGMNDAEVLEWCRTTGLLSKRPEACEEIAPVNTSPPDGIVPFFIAEAQIRQEWTDTSYIQCNVCGSRNKFKTGGYFAHYGDGYIYVVGPVCGSDDHQNSVKIARKVYEKRIKREIADARVLEFEAEPELWNKRLQNIVAYKKTVKQLQHCLNLDSNQSANDFWKDLRDSIKTDGGTLRHYPKNQNGFPTNVHRLICTDVFVEEQRNVEIEAITSRIAKQFGFSFKAENSALNYSETDVSELSKLISNLDCALQKQERYVERARKNIVKDIEGIFRWMEKNKTGLIFDGLRISGEFRITDYLGHYEGTDEVFCDFDTLTAGHQTVDVP